MRDEAGRPWPHYGLSWSDRQRIIPDDDGDIPWPAIIYFAVALVSIGLLVGIVLGAFVLG